jgi:putative transposase
MALSDGRNLDMPSLLSKGEQRRLRRLELQAARRRADRNLGGPRSKREQKAYQQIAALRGRQARRRKDWLHKTTTHLAKSHGMVVVVRSARGTVEKPGTNVRAKSAMNRSILGMAWGQTERMLSYKCVREGAILVKGVRRPLLPDLCSLRARSG